MTQFEFVTISDPREAKKHSTKVRRHVMKDIGKSRRKPKQQSPTSRSKEKTAGSRKSSSGDSADDDDTTAAAAAGREVDDAQDVLPTPRRDGTGGRGAPGRRRPMQVSIGRERDMSNCAARVPVSPWAEGLISQMVYPIEMNENKLDLLRFLIEESRYVFRPFRFLWLSLAVTDEAAWYITLANSAAWRDGDWGAMTKDISSSAEALTYYSKSLKSISERLKHVPEDSDLEGLIVAIAGCICHDATMGNFDRVNVHLLGLKRMVDRKGGMDKLTLPILPLAIAWLDLNAATFRNDAPYFPPPMKGIAFHFDDVEYESAYLNSLLQRWDSQCPSLGDIQHALIATAKVAAYVDKYGRKPEFWCDDITLARLLSPASYDILTLPGRALPDDALNDQYSGVAAREAFRRAALIFLADIKARFNAPAFEVRMHLNAFRQISHLPLVDWAAVPELNLWAHVEAALMEDVEEHRKWHIEVIAGIMSIMDLRTAAQGLGVARGIIWAESLMGKRAAQLEVDLDAHLRAMSPCAPPVQQIQETHQRPLVIQPRVLSA